MIRADHARLIISAAHFSQFPISPQQEVVFLGRSNAGKSTLINKLTGRKKLAYVGQRPGKTRLANFYEINETLMFTDVPGYGYAHRSDKEQEQYADLMEAYFAKRMQLSVGLVLLDIRRPLAEDDRMMIQLLQKKQIAYAVVLTKADKLGFGARKQAQAKMRGLVHTEVFVSGDDLPVDALSDWLLATLADEPLRKQG